MQAIQIVLAMLAGAGDEVVIPTPTWPNAAAATGIIGARPVEVPMSFGNDGWSLDLERLAAAITPRTRALFVVSPSNPTGWTATRDDLAALLALARRHGLWIVADETYARFWYGEGARAPSFFDVMEPEDRILFVNTFSKNWAMTGWRIGWIAAQPALGQVIENMIQYATSGVAQFMQRAAVAAIERGEGFVAHHDRARAARPRHLSATALGATGRCRFARAAGRVLSVLHGRRRNRHAAARDAADRRGECRARAGHRLRRRRRAVSCGCALRAMPNSSRPRSGALPRCCPTGARNSGYPGITRFVERARCRDCNRAARAKHVD